MSGSKLRFIALALGAAALLSACSGGPDEVRVDLPRTPAPAQTAETPAQTPAEAATYEPPAMKTSAYHPEAAETEDGVSADFSALADGVIAVSAVSADRLKFQALCGEEKYTYDLPNDGTPTVFPLNMGSGEYTFRVMENVTGDKYAELWSQTRTAALTDEFEPFLRPSQMVNYDGDSACVAEARTLAAGCADDVAVVKAVYDRLVNGVAYDQEKADTVQSGYLPDPDETLATGKGICFDYAALAAAMLRSLGIPCKLITGYVEPQGVYHAWNSIYLENQGWITVHIQAGAENWKRVDITFAAGGVDDTLTDNDTLYTTRYVY